MTSQNESLRQQHGDGWGDDGMTEQDPDTTDGLIVIIRWGVVFAIVALLIHAITTYDMTIITRLGDGRSAFGFIIYEKPALVLGI